MVNTRAKGMALERKAELLLQSQGYKTYRVKGSTAFNKEVDIFGEFDILAVKHGIKRWIQIKANRAPTKKKVTALLSLYHEHFNKEDSFEWWTYWNKGKRKNIFGWEIITIF